ncbi:MAG: DUF58 domain-containing protein [Gemmatimonadota bacterium]
MSREAGGKTPHSRNDLPLLDLDFAEKAGSRLVHAGLERSIFHETGSEFEHLRPYQDGDDVRGVDWNVTARVGALHVREAPAQRAQELFLVVDRSASLFGIADPRPGRAALRVASVLAAAAARRGGRVGLIASYGPNPTTLRPGSGMAHLHSVLGALAAPVVRDDTSGIAALLERSFGMASRGGIIVVISDFLPLQGECLARAFSRRGLGQEVVPVVIASRALPPSGFPGLVRFCDPESGKSRVATAGPSQGLRPPVEEVASFFLRLGESPLVLDPALEVEPQLLARWGRGGARAAWRPRR